MFLALSVVVLCIARLANGVENLTPQMGWNSWNKFGCDISEDLIKQTADALVETGLRDLGYDRLNLDDCYLSMERSSDGKVLADPERFPSGLQALSEYVQERGLRFGLYSSAGFKTCQAYPASLGMEEVDVASYTEWGVQYLKYDNCYQDHGSPQKRFTPMADAIKAAAGDDKDSKIFFSLCEWGRENPAVWASSIGGNSWRTTGDIRDDWNSIMTRAHIQTSLWRYAGPNIGWNDPDMLEVGNGKCSVEEYQTHFSLWAILKSPMIVGNDVRNLTDPDILGILGNTEVIAVNQDSLGRQARLVWSDVSHKLASSTSEYQDKLIATKCATGAEGAYEDASVDQEWNLQADGTIKSTSTGLCLSEMEGGILDIIADILPDFSQQMLAQIPREEGQYEHDMLNFTAPVRGVTTAECSSPAATKWSLGQARGGSVVSQATGKCLEVERAEELPLAQGKRIQTAPCKEDRRATGTIDLSEHQSWTSPQGTTGTLLNLYQRQCLTVDRDAHTGIEEVWVGPLQDSALAVLLLNKAQTPAVMTLSTEMLGNAVMSAYDEDVTFRMRDLWEKKDLLAPLSAKHDVRFTVPSHGSVMLKLTPN